MGETPDHVRVVEEVLGIRNAPPALARRLVSQALVVGDRRDEWRKSGERIAASAPDVPGVYVLRDVDGIALYVGKASRLRRRLRAHFAPRRWRMIKPDLARVAWAEWQEVGSEVEALVREAQWIRELAPIVNTQIGLPSIETREIPRSILKDVVVLLPSYEADSVELMAACVDGPVMVQRTRRSGVDLAVHAPRLWKFCTERRERQAGLSPIVFSWLGQRGKDASRINVGDLANARELRAGLATLLSDPELFAERIVVLNSKFRLTRRSAARAKAEPV